MTNDMRDYLYRNEREMDGRNPYGSRGGYVVSDRVRSPYPESPYENERYPYVDNTSYPRTHEDRARFHIRGDMVERDYRYHDMRYPNLEPGRHYANDFGGGLLSNKELREWQNALCKHMDQQECEAMSYEKIISQAEQMGIKFDKYTKEELFTTVLMMFTDYYKTCGPNIPMYISLAKDFLEDDDARVKYGEKLACYHDTIADV